MFVHLAELIYLVYYFVNFCLWPFYTFRLMIQFCDYRMCHMSFFHPNKLLAGLAESRDLWLLVLWLATKVASWNPKSSSSRWTFNLRFNFLSFLYEIPWFLPFWCYSRMQLKSFSSKHDGLPRRMFQEAWTDESCSCFPKCWVIYPSIMCFAERH